MFMDQFYLNWKKNLDKIGNKEKRKTVYKASRILLTEQDVEKCAGFECFFFLPDMFSKL